MIVLNRQKLIYLISLIMLVLVAWLGVSVYNLQQKGQLNEQILMLNQGEMLPPETRAMDSPEVRIA